MRQSGDRRDPPSRTVDQPKWQTEIDELCSHTRRYSILRGDGAVSFAEAMAGWRDDPGFRAFFVSLLAAAPFEAFLWETPPVTRATMGRAFEFVLIDSPELAVATPNPTTFAAHFGATEADRDIIAFPNLGHDAWLVAPCPRSDRDVYPHLAAFVRGAPEPQRHAMWREVAIALESRLGENPLWLSTAGLGVFWLHVRLDTHPKYYHHARYRRT